MDIVIIGSEEVFEAEDLGTRTKQIADALAAKHRVLVVNNSYSVLSRIKNRLLGNKDLPKLYRKRKRGLRYSLLEKSESQFFLCTQFFLPESIRSSRATVGVIGRILSKSLEVLGFSPEVVLYADHRLINIQLPNVKTVFLPTDNMKYHPKKTSKSAEIDEAYLWASQQADAVVVASESQRNDFEREDVHILPNGISPRFLNEGECEIPEDLAELPPPRIVYAGILQSRFDTVLFQRVAQSLPDYSFALIGPLMEPQVFEELQKVANVYFLGKKDYSNLPLYLRHADCGVIPHKINEFTNSMSPLKLIEYLSSGIQVVSTPVNGTETFSPYISLATEAGDFAEKIREAVKDKETGKDQNTRRSLVENFTWEKRAEGLTELFTSLLAPD
jgi:glycosyltransferase involved in cell wall biosynthesis